MITYRIGSNVNIFEEIFQIYCTENQINIILLKIINFNQIYINIRCYNQFIAVTKLNLRINKVG